MEMQDTLGCDEKSSLEGVGNASVRMTNGDKAQDRRPVDSGMSIPFSHYSMADGRTSRPQGRVVI